jgi:DNA polymerase I-like protein with 3'-5' exonuclease and polymerase domains
VPTSDGVHLGPLANLLKSEDHRILFHNAKFDWKFLTHNGYEINNAVCTFVQEKLLTAGLNMPTKLKSVAERRLGIEMSKEERTTFYDGTFKEWTPELIKYATDDVWVLPEIAQQQVIELDSKGLLAVNAIEQSLIPIIARMEMLGVYIDKDECKAFAKEMRKRADELEILIREQLEPHWQVSWRRDFKEALDIYSAWEREWSQVKKATAKRNEECRANRVTWLEGNPKPCDRPRERESININSREQLQAALKESGIELPNMKKETLQDAAGMNRELDTLLDYRKFDKLAQMAELEKYISPETGRIHCNLNQNGTGTGRFSCTEPNLQQVPTRTDEGKRLRRVFKPPDPSRRLIIADYAAIELVLIAAESRDEVLLEAIRDTSIDLHCWTMAKFLDCGYECVTAIRKGNDDTVEFDEVVEARLRFEQKCHIPELEKTGKSNSVEMRQWVNRLRDVVKTLTYGIAYGLSEFGLARKFHMSVEAARALIELFFSAYPSVKSYLESQAKFAWDYGFSVTPLGRRREFRKPLPVTRERVQAAVREKLEGREVDTVEYYYVYGQTKREMDREFFFRQSSIMRQGANAPIQGASADMTKLALIYIDRLLREHDLPEDDYPRLCVHDELILECAVENAEVCARLLERAMEEAAYAVLPTDLGLVVKVEASIEEVWKK